MPLMPENSAPLLLVDDDISFCQVLSRALEKRGFVVSGAHNVKQALPLLETQRLKNG